MKLTNRYPTNYVGLLTISLIIVLISLSNSAHSQVKVWSNNNVTVGWANQAPSQVLHVWGDAFNKPAVSTSGFSFTNYHNNWTPTGGGGTTYYDEPILKPVWGNAMWVGNYDFPLWRAFSHRFYQSDGPTVWSFSDSRLKQNIAPFSGSAISKVSNINAYTYDMNPEQYQNIEEEKRTQLAEEGKSKIGFIAQEVQVEFPEMVKTVPGTEFLAVNYGMMIPVLLEAIKEQQEQIEQLEQRIVELESN